MSISQDDLSISWSRESQPQAASLSESAANGSVFIEQVRATRECSASKRPHLTACDHERKRLLHYRPPCKMWACPGCSEQNRRRWTARVAYGSERYLADGEKLWFMTVSSHESLFTLDRQLFVWRSAWTKLRARIRRASVGTLHYALLPELAPETGRFHIHAIINQSFDAVPSKTRENAYSCRFLKDAPRQCGLGYANDIRPVNSAGAAAAYTAGYVGKTLGVPDWPTHFHRVRVTADWPELPELPSPADGLAWGVVSPALLEALISQMWFDGYDVVSVNTGQILEVIDLPELLAVSDV